MKYLGVDYGKKKIGLAYSEGELSEPWRVIEISGLKDAVLKISRILRDENVMVLVIGMPESGEARSMAENFRREIRKLSEVLLVEMEETLSSQMANQRVRDLGVAKSREDAIAASLILQNYLDSLKS